MPVRLLSVVKVAQFAEIHINYAAQRTNLISER